MKHSHKCHPIGPELIIVFDGEVFYSKGFEWLQVVYEQAIN